MRAAYQPPFDRDLRYYQAQIINEGRAFVWREL